MSRTSEIDGPHVERRRWADGTGVVGRSAELVGRYVAQRARHAERRVGLSNHSKNLGMQVTERAPVHDHVAALAVGERTRHAGEYDRYIPVVMGSAVAHVADPHDEGALEHRLAVEVDHL